MAQVGFDKGGGEHNRGSGGETPSRRRPRGFGGYAPSRQRIFTVFKYKNTHFSTLFYRKRACSDATTMDNAKILPPLMSKS